MPPGQFEVRSGEHAAQRVVYDDPARANAANYEAATTQAEAALLAAVLGDYTQYARATVPLREDDPNVAIALGEAAGSWWRDVYTACGCGAPYGHSRGPGCGDSPLAAIDPALAELEPDQSAAAGFRSREEAALELAAWWARRTGQLVVVLAAAEVIPGGARVVPVDATRARVALCSEIPIGLAARTAEPGQLVAVLQGPPRYGGGETAEAPWHPTHPPCQEAHILAGQYRCLACGHWVTCLFHAAAGQLMEITSGTVLADACLIHVSAQAAAAYRDRVREHPEMLAPSPGGDTRFGGVVARGGRQATGAVGLWQLHDDAEDARRYTMDRVRAALAQAGVGAAGGRIQWREPRRAIPEAAARYRHPAIVARMEAAARSCMEVWGQLDPVEMAAAERCPLPLRELDDADPLQLAGGPGAHYWAWRHVATGVWIGRLGEEHNGLDPAADATAPVACTAGDVRQLLADRGLDEQDSA